MMNEVQRILDWINKKPVGPYILELRMTNRCNLRCLLCWEWTKQQDVKNELPDEIYPRIIKEAKEMNVRRIDICGGGEPLIKSKVLFDIMTQTKRYGMEGRLITNGTLFTPDSIKQLVNVGWDEIIFSLDAPDAKTHDYLRGSNGTFNKVVENIKLFDNYKKQLNKKVPRILLAPVLTNLIHDKTVDMVKFAHNLGTQEVCFQLMIDKTSDCKNLMLNDGQRGIFLKKITETKRIADEYNIKCNIEDFSDKTVIEKSSEKKAVFEKDAESVKMKEIMGAPCFFPWFYIGISADGTVQPCADAPAGNEFENVKEKSLKEIWFGEKFDEFRERLMEKNLFPWCERCCGNKIFETRFFRKELLSALNKKSQRR